MEQKEKSEKELKAEEKVRQARANLAQVRREEREKIRRTQDRHKYMMGGCVLKYFPEAYDFNELEMNRIIACAFSLEGVQKMIVTVLNERSNPEEGNSGNDAKDVDSSKGINERNVLVDNSDTDEENA